jgi:hypothetical protein
MSDFKKKHSYGPPQSLTKNEVQVPSVSTNDSDKPENHKVRFQLCNARKPSL